MQYALKTREGKFISFDPEQTDDKPLKLYEGTHREYLPIEKSGSVFYLKGNPFYTALIHCDWYKAKVPHSEAFNWARGFSFVDLNGTEYLLDWDNLKTSGKFLVGTVPIKKVIYRQYPLEDIPELWRPYPRAYIDHILVKVHPYDHSIQRYKHECVLLDEIQSVYLYELDRSVKDYLAGTYKTMHWITKKAKQILSFPDPAGTKLILTVMPELLFDHINDCFEGVECPVLIARKEKSISHIKKILFPA